MTYEDVKRQRANVEKRYFLIFNSENLTSLILFHSCVTLAYFIVVSYHDGVAFMMMMVSNATQCPFQTLLLI